MCYDIAASLALQGIGGLMSSNAQRDAGMKTQEYYNYLGNLSEKQAGYAQDQGALDTSTLRKQVKQLVGTQKAVMAAKGISADSVTAQDISLDTFNKQQLDEMTIRYNADLKSNAALDQARGYRMSGANAVTAANMNADSTLIGAASSVADSLMKWKAKT